MDEKKIENPNLGVVISGGKSGYAALKPIYPTGYVQWDVYTVIREAWGPFRGLTVKTPKIAKADFIKTLQFTGYVTLEMDGDEKITVAILDSQDGSSPVAAVTERFKLFYNSIKSPDMKLIIISPIPFQSHVMTYINDNGLADSIQRFSYDHFKHVVPLGPNCSRHTILDEKQAEAVLNTFKVQRRIIRQIYSTDPMVAWTGAHPNQIIMIERRNAVTGVGTDYRRVVKVSNL